MPYRRFDWHEHLADVAREFSVARSAMDRFLAEIGARPDILSRMELKRIHIRAADQKLEGTYIVRLFAAFEAALRSFDRAKNNDANRHTPAAIMIDSIGGRRSFGIAAKVRAGAHAVRELRNYWAHERDNLPNLLTLDEARVALQRFLSWLPPQWG